MKKPDKSDKNKDRKSDRTSDFNYNNNQKRSNKFDDLTGTSSYRPNNPGGSGTTTKEKLKKIWKWIAIVILLFLAGLGITGLIQGCVLHTSSTVGAGIELYRHKDEVAPYVSTYEIVEKTRNEIIYDSNGNPVLDENGNYKYEKRKYYVLQQKTKDNYLASRQNIRDIKFQLSDLYGSEVSDLYGDYGNYSSALRVLGTENLPMNSSNVTKVQGDLTSDGLLKGDNSNDFIFMNNKILNYLNQNGIQYKPQNTWHDINFFVAAKPSNWDSSSDSVKDAYGLGNTNIASSFQAFENVGTENQPNWVKVETINGHYVTKDVNGDGVIDSSTYVEITDTERMSKFRYSLNAEVVSLSSVQDDMFNSEAYARDYYQSLNNFLIHFSQLDDFYALINKVASTSITSISSNDQIYSALSKTNFENLVNDQVVTYNNNGIDQRAFDQNKLFTLQERNAIITYQNEVTNLMTKLGFGIRPQVYSDENSQYYQPTPTPFKVTFLPTKNNVAGVVLGTSSVAQKPITSWGEAWKLGPFYGLIVWPLSYIINGMMGPMPNMHGWSAIIAIVVAILITRIIVSIFTYKSYFASHKQQQLNPKKAKIDAKYAQYKGNREMEQKKREEIAKLYKSHNISMTGPIKAMCISLPIFIAVWRVIQGIPDIKDTTWLGIQFSLTSWKELFGGAWQYLPLLVLAAGIQIISQILPRILNKKRLGERANKAEIAALKKSNKTQNIVLIVYVVMSVLFEAGVQIYWIVSGLWQIMQILAVHHIVRSEWYKTKGHKYL